MGLLFRGIVWFGLYLALALAPLLAAAIAGPPGGVESGARPFLLEAAVALGFVGFALMAIEFALVARLRAASQPFGTDALMQFHRHMGLAAVVGASLHGLLLARDEPGFGPRMASMSGDLMGSLGVGSLLVLLLLIASSIARRRLRLAYERWQTLHRVGAVIVVAAAAAHIQLAQGYSSSPVVTAVLWSYVVGFCALLVGYRVLRPLRLRRRPWTLIASRDIGADTRLLRLRPEAHAGLADAAPGQFAWLVTGVSPSRGESHPLSIASSVHAPAGGGGEIEFAVKALGDWSGQIVPALQAGTTLWVEGPFGTFTPDRVPAQAFVLIAGGIGVAPMRSMILTLRERGDRRPITLFFATHDPSRAMFLAELQTLAAQKTLDLVTVYESPPAGAAGERGYVDAPLLRRHLPADTSRHHFFVCGPPPMMDALESVLIELGVRAANVHTERFDLV